MLSLTANIRNEMIKMALKKRTIAFLALTLLLPVAAGILLSRFQQGIGIGAFTSQDFPIMMLGILTSVLLPLFLFMNAADSFAGEIGDRTMKNVLTRPITRFGVFTSKQAALALSAIAYLAAGFLASTLSSLLLQHSGGFGTVLKWLLAYGAAFVPLLVISMLGVLLAQFFRNSGAALTVSILLYLAVKAGGFFLPQVNRFSPTSYLDWHMLWVGSGLDFGRISAIFMFFLACSILLFTAGFYVFDRKEL
ncbi:ABC transporter permease [Paenibacillus oryzisoli]|uniref:ABC transporter permease n=1 Tax=Paenibacillus oryzisoli TaxID=1850517 RepID=UPI003D2BCA9C